MAKLPHHPSGAGNQASASGSISSGKTTPVLLQYLPLVQHQHVSSLPHGNLPQTSRSNVADVTPFGLSHVTKQVALPQFTPSTAPGQASHHVLYQIKVKLRLLFPVMLCHLSLVKCSKLFLVQWQVKFCNIFLARPCKLHRVN